jgi:uncharacterized membrane protein YgaE (UPF0421/DUF939 family)
MWKNNLVFFTIGVLVTLLFVFLIHPKDKKVDTFSQEKVSILTDSLSSTNVMIKDLREKVALDSQNVKDKIKKELNSLQKTNAILKRQNEKLLYIRSLSPDSLYLFGASIKQRKYRIRR